MNVLVKALSATLLCSVAFLYAPTSVAEPKVVRAVVLAMVERGAVQGDGPGEFQFWVNEYPLPEKIEFPLGVEALYWNPDEQVLGMLTGPGVTNAATSIMALGMDPRFDLRQAYWLIAGIAGGDPADTSLGSAVWASHVVDGDLAYEIDGREIPPQWPYGMIPLGQYEPVTDAADLTEGWTVDTVHFALNPQLARWAYELTAKTPLDDTPEMRAFRQQFVGHAAARLPPRVMLGDTLSASTYWHGQRLNRWANDWVRIYGGPEANFVTSNMEDSGTLTALARLAQAGRADLDRVMVLRTVSNYTQPPAGKDTSWSATAEYPNDGVPALRAAFTVGATVLRSIVKNWATFGQNLPAPDEPATND